MSTSSRPKPPARGRGRPRRPRHDADGARILDLEPQRVRGEVDADEHGVLGAELTVHDAVGDQLADQQLGVVEDPRAPPVRVRQWSTTIRAAPGAPEPAGRAISASFPSAGFGASPVRSFEAARSQPGQLGAELVVLRLEGGGATAQSAQGRGQAFIGPPARRYDQHWSDRCGSSSLELLSDRGHRRPPWTPLWSIRRRSARGVSAGVGGSGAARRG